MGNSKPQVRISFLSRSLLLALAVVAGASVPLADGHAQASSAAGAVAFDIPAGELAAAVDRFAEQSGLQIVSDRPLLQGRSVPALKGRYVPEAALRLLLQGSGVEFERLNDRTVVLKRAAAAPTSVKKPVPQQDVIELDRVVVTGTHIRGIGVQPIGSDLIALDREDIVASGNRTTAEVLATLPQTAFFNGLPRPPFSPTVFMSTPVDLRNLGNNATLVLIDGQRLIGDGTLNTFANPSSVPPAAIQRIEIIPDGFSAIYGSDAVAGVLNIITRKDLDGSETSLRYGRGNGEYNAIDFSQAFGRTWETGSAMIVGAFSRSDRLKNSDLDIYKEDLTPHGGPDFRSISCVPPNVLINGTTYSFPDFAPGGVRCVNGYLFDIASEQQSASVLLNLKQSFFDDLQFYGTVKYAKLDMSTEFPAFATVNIPSTNPFFRLPPGVEATSEDVILNLYSVYGLPEGLATGRSGNAIVGLDYAFGKGKAWNLSNTLNYGWGKGRVPFPSFNAAALNTAAQGTTPETALDPFGHGTHPDVVARIADWESVNKADQELIDYRIVADGPLATLPAGDVQLAVGAGYMEHEYDAKTWTGPRGTAPSAQQSATRTVRSAFAEVLLPITGEGFNVPGVYSLTLSAAVRHDKYNDVGSTTNPKLGVNWRPFRDLKLRGNKGTSFHAPNMGARYAVDTRATFSSSAGTDLPGNPIGNLITIVGGSPNLRPEEADTWSAGFDYTPSWLPGLQVSATYYDIEFRNQIAVPPGGVELLTNPLFGDLWIENPTAAQVGALLEGLPLVGFPDGAVPPILLITDMRRVNMSATNTDGIDFAIRYGWQNRFGDWVAKVSGNNIHLLERQRLEGAAFVEDRAVPKLKVRGDLNWTKGPWSIDASGRYLDSFQVGAETIGSFTTYDLNVRYAFQAQNTIWSDLALTLTVNNVLDEDPPFQMRIGGFSERANPLGRMIWLGVKKDFDW